MNKKTLTQWLSLSCNRIPVLCVFAFACVFLFTQKIHAQSCPPNLDFEQGNFNGWECSTGNTTVVAGQNVINLSPSGPVPNRHTLISATSSPTLDPYGGFPRLCPYGGNYSVKLGNNSGGAQAEGLSYTFTIPSNQDTFTFTYFYAVVFENPSHSLYEQPRFFATAYEVSTGALINCASYNYVATGGIPGFQVSPVNNTVLYKEWSPVSIQFAGLAGKTVKLEFKTADCTLNGHFGYAYVDVSSGCTNILASAPYCIETNSLVLTAPYGFQSYTWYNTDYSLVLGNTQSITLSPPPISSGVLHVDLVPYPGYGCRDTADAIVTPINAPPAPAAQTEYTYCQYAPATALTATGSPGNILYWYTTPTGGIGSTSAPVPSTTIPGIYDYYVLQKELFGCESPRTKITVTVKPVPIPAFGVNNPVQCVTGNQFVFTSNSTGLFGPVYDWDFGDGQTFSSSTSNTATHSYATHGNYTVKLKVTNPPTCSAEITRTITVHAKPLANIGVPPVICEQQTVVALTDNSTVPGGASTVNKWWWNLNGSVTTTQTPPVFTLNNTQFFPVQLAVSSAAGCLSDTVTVQLQAKHIPVARFTMGRAFCENEAIQFTDASFIPNAFTNETVNKWDWKFGPVVTSSQQNPGHIYPVGIHNAQLVATTNFGCVSKPLDTLITVHTKPASTLRLLDSCARRPAIFLADNRSGDIVKWYWNLDGRFQPGSNPLPIIFPQATAGTVRVSGETIFGCRDTVALPFVIYDNLAYAGNDTMAPLNEPVQLNANGGNNTLYTWTPPEGLNNANIENPIATSDHDMTYSLYAITDKGCTSRSQIRIVRYKGPDVYVPSAFTPNNDGRNDYFRAVGYGIRQFDYLAVFDRLGNEVFRTTDIRVGWDGKYKGVEANAGTYVFMMKATDYKGRGIFKKGTVILIR